MFALFRYARILSDFQYLKNSDAFEEAIDSSSSLTDLDAEFRELNSEILRRFYFLFESIYSYAKVGHVLLAPLNPNCWCIRTWSDTWKNWRKEYLFNSRSIWSC